MIRWGTTSETIHYLRTYRFLLNFLKRTAKVLAVNLWRLNTVFFCYYIKAGVHVNRSEIWSNIKGEFLGLKYVGSTGYQTVDPPPKGESLVGRGLFGIRLLILHFKFQFSKSIKSSTFHTFLNLSILWEKISLSQNAQEKHPKIYTKPRNSGQWK